MCKVIIILIITLRSFVITVIGSFFGLSPGRITGVIVVFVTPK